MYTEAKRSKEKVKEATELKLARTSTPVPVN